MSQRRALLLQGLDAAGADAELAEIEKENAQSMPSTLLGEPIVKDAVTQGSGASPAPVDPGMKISAA